jgi:hypothetical protein
MISPTNPAKRAVAALLALATGGNGIAMLAAGAWWYRAVPGVVMTGPFNPHFVKDIGAAYLAAGAALGWFAARPTSAARGAAIAGAAFLALHAAIHLAEAAIDPMGASHLVRDFAGVLAPPLIAAWALWPPRARKGDPTHA